MENKLPNLTHAEVLEALTNSERDVLRMLSEGLDTEAITDKRSVSVGTYYTQLAAIKLKLGVSSRHAAVAVYLNAVHKYPIGASDVAA